MKKKHKQQQSPQQWRRRQRRGRWKKEIKAANEKTAQRKKAKEEEKREYRMWAEHSRCFMWMCLMSRVSCFMHVSCLLCTYWFRWKITKTTTMTFREREKNDPRTQQPTSNTEKKEEENAHEINANDVDDEDDGRSIDRLRKPYVWETEWKLIHTWVDR